jgi:hypothetical protein
LPDLIRMTTTPAVPTIRFSKNLLEQISKDEFCVLSYYQTSQPKTLRDMQRLLGIGSDRRIRTLSLLRSKLLIHGKATQPETIQLLPTTIPQEGEVVCVLPTWVIFTVPSRAADKQLLCYYFREGESFDGTVTELAAGIGMKHRNANYCLDFMVSKKVIKRVNVGQKVRIDLLEQPKRGFFSFFT